MAIVFPLRWVTPNGFDLSSRCARTAGLSFCECVTSKQRVQPHTSSPPSAWLCSPYHPPCRPRVLAHSQRLHLPKIHHNSIFSPAVWNTVLSGALNGVLTVAACAVLSSLLDIPVKTLTGFHYPLNHRRWTLDISIKINIKIVTMHHASLPSNTVWSPVTCILMSRLQQWVKWS